MGAAPDAPVFSGTKSHTFNGEVKKTGAALFLNPTHPLPFGARDVLFFYVYIDPKNPPKEIMMHCIRTLEHRLTGRGQIQFGKKRKAADGHGIIAQNRRMVRLEVPGAI